MTARFVEVGPEDGGGGFDLLLGDRVILRHRVDAPAFRIAKGNPTVTMVRGNFRMEDAPSESYQPRKAVVSRDEGGGTRVDFTELGLFKPELTLVVSEDGFLVLINRGSYWQAAMPLPKGDADQIRALGLPAFRQRITRIAPHLEEAAARLASWDEVKLLTVQVNHMPKWWRPGFLCIGDAAHAMSPVGGVGINLAVQDAVAAARILGPLLGKGAVPDEAIATVQARRHWPARMVQRAQVAAHRLVIVPAITARGPMKPPLLLNLFNWLPILRQIPARAIGLGLRPEHWPAGK